MAAEPSSRLTLTKSERRFPPPWSSARDGWPRGARINRLAKFLSNKGVLGAVALTRLICTRCRADVEGVLRCRRCGALCPTSQIGAALLSPSAFVFYVLVLVVIAIFWFA